MLVCDRGYNHIADVMITLHNGLVIKGVETTEDMYSSIDLVMAKIERQVRRYKEKIRSHKGAEGLHGQREIIHSVLAEPAEDGDGAAANGHARGGRAGDHQEVEVLRQAAVAQRGGDADEPPRTTIFWFSRTPLHTRSMWCIVAATGRTGSSRPAAKAARARRRGQLVRRQRLSE